MNQLSDVVVVNRWRTSRGAEVSPLLRRDTIVLSRVDAVDAIYTRDIPERVGWLLEHGRRRVRVRAQVRLICAVLTFVVSKTDTGRCGVGVARYE